MIHDAGRSAEAEEQRRNSGVFLGEHAERERDERRWIAPAPLGPRAREVEATQRAERGERLGATHHGSHRFHMDRVDSEQERPEQRCALRIGEARRAREQAPQIEDEQAAQDVERDVDDVVAHDVRPADGVVDRVGERRHGPVQAGVVPRQGSRVVRLTEDRGNIVEALDQAVVEDHPAVVEHRPVAKGVCVSQRGGQRHYPSRVRNREREHPLQGGAGARRYDQHR